MMNTHAHRALAPAALDLLQAYVDLYWSGRHAGRSMHSQDVMDMFHNVLLEYWFTQSAAEWICLVVSESEGVSLRAIVEDVHREV